MSDRDVVDAAGVAFWSKPAREVGGPLTATEFLDSMAALYRAPARRKLVVTSVAVIEAALRSAARGERRAVALGLAESRTRRWRWRRRRRLAAEREEAWRGAVALRATFEGSR